MTRAPSFLVATLALVLPCAPRAEVAPLGPTFQVNTYTTGYQEAPAVAGQPGGGFVVVWQSGFFGVLQDGSGPGVFAQAFDAAGLPAGGEFRVNAFTLDSQRRPAIAAAAGGTFVVGWESGTYFGPGQDGSAMGAFVRRVDGTGGVLGGEFQANTHTPDFQREVAVAADPAGNFVVVWESSPSYFSASSPPQDGSGAGVFAQRFDPAGTALGGEFRVNTYTTSDQRSPAVAADAAGNFVVVWQSGGYYSGQDGSRRGIFAQRFTSGGAPTGPEFQVNTYTLYDQARPQIAVDGSGAFVVTWESGTYYRNGQDGSARGIYAQRFDATASPIGGEFRVNTTTLGDQSSPAVGADAAGNFLVVWASYDDREGLDVFAQHFTSGAERLGPEFRIDTPAGGREAPSVAAAGDGNFVVVWESYYGGSLDPSGVFARRFRTTATRPPRAVLGTRLALRDDAADPRRKALAVRSRDVAIDLASATGEDSPTARGGTLRLRSAHFDLTYDLPAPWWRATPGGFEYRDPNLLAGPIRLIRLKDGVGAKIVGRGAQLGHALDANPDPLTVFLTLGVGGPRFCLTFGGTTTFRPGRAYRAAGAPALACLP